MTKASTCSLGVLLALLLAAAPVQAQIDPVVDEGDDIVTEPTGAEPAAGEEGKPAEGEEGKPAEGELRRGAYTEEQFEQEEFSPEVAALQEKQSELRREKVRKLQEILDSNPYHPNKADLFFRLAETHWEEAHYQFLKSMLDYEKSFTEYEAGRLSQEPEMPKEDYSASLDYYRKIIAQFPQYSRIDEVFYYLGLGALKAGKSAGDRALQKEGVQYFQKLVQEYPESRFIAEAHLKLGEYYFENNSLYYAKVNYETIINNHKTAGMYNYALYKLAWVYFNLREFRKAIETFQAVVSELDAAGGIAAKIEFKSQALNDLVVTFAELENGWEEAREYFMGVIGEEEAYKKLRKLADLYVAQDKDGLALELYNHLVDYEPNSERVPYYFNQLVEVRKRLNVWAETESEMRRMIEYFDRDGTWWSANQSNKEVLKEADTMAENTLLFIANYYHRQAQKLKDDKGLYAQAGKDYALFLKKFPESKKAYVVNFYYAEILYHDLQDYEGAAEQYGEVIKKDTKGEFVEDAALGVLYCYEELMVKEGVREFASKGQKIERVKLSAAEVRERKKPIPKTPLHPLEEKYVGAADKYVELLTAFIKDPELRKKEDEKAAEAKKKGETYEPRGTDIPRIMFIAAEVFYKHGQFEDAVKRLKTIFDYDPNHEFAGIAVNTLLDAYVRLRHWDKVEFWARELIKVKNFKVKSQSELERIIATAINEGARDKVVGGDVTSAVAEMERLLKEFQRKDPELAAKVMYNLAALYERAHDRKKAIATYERVIKTYPKSPMAAEAQYTIGLMYEGQTMFTQAAETFEEFTDKKFRDFEKAPQALLNAALLREAIEDYDGAIKDYESYVSLFADKKGVTNIPDVWFRVGVVEEAKKSESGWRAAHDHYQKFIKKYGKSPELQTKIVEAYARAGRALKLIDKNLYRKDATKLFEQAALTFSKLPEDRKRGAARHQAAMALFEIAEYVFDDYAAVKILATDPRELKKVLIQKAELFKAAEQLYDQVLVLKSSGWTAGAMFRQGLLYYDFAENLLNAPVPEELSEDMQAEYVMALEEFAAPVQEKSLVAFQTAMAFAREKGVYNQWSKQSGQYAAKVNPDQFPLAEEPYVAADEVNDTLASQAFIRTLRRGDTEVQILKWQKTKVKRGEGGGVPAEGAGAPEPAPAAEPADASAEADDADAP